MGIDYYGVLKLKKCATSQEIKQAYRRLAVKLHPSSKIESDEEEFVTFSMVGEAYDVLKDDFYRAVYDQYGEEGLKSGVPGPHEYIQPYKYHGDPLRTYQEFFGVRHPYADLLDFLVHPPPFFNDGVHIGIKKKDPDVYHKLPLTLNEVFYGGVKQVVIHRRELCDPTDPKNTETKSSDNLLTIEFSPGIEPGTEFRFIEAGNQGTSIIPADVIFVIEDEPHPVFKRKCEKNIVEPNVSKKSVLELEKFQSALDINRENKPEESKNEKCFLPISCMSTTIPITLSEALTGFKATVNTIDGKILRIPITDIVTPNYEKIIPGEGLPIFGDKQRRRGNLHLYFDISFPLLPLTKKNRMAIQDALSPSVGTTDLNRSILAQKMNRLSSKEQSPP